MKCLNKKCKSKSLKGPVEFRSQDIVVTCDTCKHVNTVDAMQAGGYIHFKVSRADAPIEPIKEDKGDGKKTGSDKKTDK